MVKVGFICEGKTERMLVESPPFQEWMTSNLLTCIHPIENADGNGNLLPRNIEPIRNRLILKGAEHIVILTDLDNDACITHTRHRISERPNQSIIVAVKTIEAWFLADTSALTQFLKQSVFIENPELDEKPYDTLRDLFIKHTSQGVGTKPILARRMLKYGFTIQQAARHPNCPSAAYFLSTLQTLATAN